MFHENPGCLRYELSQGSHKVQRGGRSSGWVVPQPNLVPSFSPAPLLCEDWRQGATLALDWRAAKSLLDCSSVAPI